jgi:hypothetical protein
VGFAKLSGLFRSGASKLSVLAKKILDVASWLEHRHDFRGLLTNVDERMRDLAWSEHHRPSVSLPET